MKKLILKLLTLILVVTTVLFISTACKGIFNDGFIIIAVTELSAKVVQITTVAMIITKHLIILIRMK